jgi:hypothetical protein
MGEAKRKRVMEAALARDLKRARETNALAVAALRAESVRVILLEELQAAAAGTEQFGTEHRQALSKIEVNRASRATAMLMLFYASLNVVVEGWMKPKSAPAPTDEKIDTLLKAPYTGTLEKYRHSVMHPSPLDDDRQLRFAEVHSELSAWAATLSQEFVRYFRDWRLAFERVPTGEAPTQAI